MTDGIITALFKPSRQIGPYTPPVPSGVPALAPFTAQVTIEEVHMDELVITEHPVEQGASITDHAFKKPAELLLRLGWSNSGLLGVLGSVASYLEGGEFSNIKAMYNKLLSIAI